MSESVKQLQKVVYQMECIFGLDISKHTANVAVLIDRQVIKEFKLSSNREGFERLEDELNSFREPKIIFESTGIYSRPWRAFFQRNGWLYTEINPLKAKKVMDSFRAVKTDSVDAVGLAEAMSRNHFLPSFQEKSEYTELRELHRIYQEHNDDVVRNKNRLHHELQLTFPEIEHFLSRPEGGLYWHIVQKFPHPHLVLQHGSAELTSIILGATQKNMGSKRAQRLAEHLLELAKSSEPALDTDSYAIKRVIELAYEVERLDRLKESLIEEMAKIGTSLPEVAILTTIPGIALKSALCIIAELGDIRRFHSANAINAYIGIDLTTYQSGDYMAKQRIRKRGNALARKVLYRTVINIISASSYRPTHFNDFYQMKKQSSQSKGTKKIAIAVMSRLNRTIFHLVLNNEAYEPTVFQPKQ